MKVDKLYQMISNLQIEVQDLQKALGKQKVSYQSKSLDCPFEQVCSATGAYNDALEMEERSGACFPCRRYQFEKYY